MTSDPMFTTQEMDEVFSATTRVRRMVDVEAALARALGSAGVIPPAAADAIATACDAAQMDADAIMTEAVVAGTPVVPLLARLREAVGPDVRDLVHLGATSQDVIDTAAVLQMREALGLLLADLSVVGRLLAAIAQEHRNTPMAGRTLLQQALPTTFGLKAAHWLAAVTDQVERLAAAREALPLSLGGAVGTLADYGEDADRVASDMAGELGLVNDVLPWHSRRDVPAAVVADVALTVRTVGKIAGDVVLLAQTEVGEVAESPAPGKGVSSAMAHKRNPVDAVTARAAARLALGSVSVVLLAFDHEHERAAGAWQAEWAAIPDVFRYAAGAVAATRRSLDGLEVNAARMRENLAHLPGSGGVLSTARSGALVDRALARFASVSTTIDA